MLVFMDKIWCGNRTNNGCMFRDKCPRVAKESDIDMAIKLHLPMAVFSEKPACHYAKEKNNG